MDFSGKVDQLILPDLTFLKKKPLSVSQVCHLWLMEAEDIRNTKGQSTLLERVLLSMRLKLLLADGSYRKTPLSFKNKTRPTQFQKYNKKKEHWR